jgi:hypothetical protein
MEKADLNGGILMLPKGFKLAAKNEIPKKLKKRINTSHHTVLNSTIYLLLDQSLEKLTKS